MTDGDFVCAQCGTKLNQTDRNCWRCGSRELKDMRPMPALIDLSTGCGQSLTDMDANTGTLSIGGGEVLNT